MDILISFRDGKKVRFMEGTVIGFKSTDRTFCVITNKSRDMDIYNMSTIDGIHLKVKEGSVNDYLITD